MIYWFHLIFRSRQRPENLGLRFGTDYAAMYDSTMARFWFLNDAARARVTRALAAEPRPQVRDPVGGDGPDRARLCGQRTPGVDPGFSLYH